MKITTIGIDLAKEVFQIHGVDTHGQAVLRKPLRRSEMAKFFANLEPCLIGMEACGSAVSTPPCQLHVQLAGHNQPLGCCFLTT